KQKHRDFKEISNVTSAHGTLGNIVAVKPMPHPLFKTEIDAAQVLLQAGWRPNEINGILQFPLSEEAFRGLGANSLFFLVSDPSLAEDLRPGARQEAIAALTAHGWTEIEIEALLRPARQFSAYPRPFDDLPSDGSPTTDDITHDFYDDGAIEFAASPKVKSSLAVPHVARFSTVPLGVQPLRQYRRSLGLNRLLGLGLVIVAVGIFACVLP
ncbi:MAG: hypothetical protein AAFU71_18940, partial [Cyanobacteria bacterium J06632_22]